MRAIRLFGRSFKTWAGAVRATMRAKRINKTRASAYVAVVDRRQNGPNWSPQTNRQMALRRRGRGGRPVVSRMRRADGRVFRGVTIYKKRPRGYQWKVVCKGKLFSFAKRKSFALDLRKAATARHGKGCRTLKA